MADRGGKDVLERALVQVLETGMEEIRERTSFHKVVLLGALDGHVIGRGTGISEAEVGSFAASFSQTRTKSPAEMATAAAPLFHGLSSMRSPTLVRVRPRAELEAAAVVDAAGDDPNLDRVREVLRIACRALEQHVELESLRAKVRTLAQQRQRAHSALEALPDPVLVMDADSRIRLANRRAEDLFVITADDSLGRRHAVEANNLYFSAFRARTLLEKPEAPLRELVLVDPTDGSDLLFEVSVLPFHESDGPSDGWIFVLRDITDLKRATHELEIQFGRAIAARHEAHRESQRLNVIIDNAGVPILVTDPQSNVVLLNREAERLLTAGSSERVDAARAGGNDARLAGFINEFVLQTTLRREGRLTLVDPDEEKELPALVVSNKILKEHGEPTAIVTVVHDLTKEEENRRLAHELRALNVDLERRIAQATTEVAERNAQLERQTVELERASRMKSEFLATMSHELRTPINAMVGYSSLLRDGMFGQLNDEQRHAIDRMRTAFDHLLTLINDILDLSRVEAGQVQVSAVDIDLADCLKALSDSVRPIAAQKSLSYCLDLDPDLPSIRTDLTRLRQVLLNLLSNAVKFTDAGSVTLRAFPRDRGTRVRVEVADTGIGIAAEDIDRIFDEFTQADQSVTRERGGTGLGLAISRKLIEVLGGELGVSSEPGRGSTFIVELPVLPPVSWGDLGAHAVEAKAAAPHPLSALPEAPR